MLSTLRRRSPSSSSALAAGLALSLGACAASSEPPKVATVSTEAPPTVPAGTPTAAPSASPVSAAPAAPAAPAEDSAPPPEEEANSKDAVARIDMLDLDAKKLEALMQAALGQGTGPGVSVLSNAVPMGALTGGTVGGLSLGGGSGAANGGLAGIGATTVTGPVVGVTLGAVQVMGSSISSVDRITAGMVPGFRRCLNRAVQTDPTSVKTGSKLVVKATVDKAGTVTSATATGVTDIPAIAVACITRRVSMATFAPPDSGASQVQIPISVQITP